MSNNPHDPNTADYNAREESFAQAGIDTGTQVNANARNAIDAEAKRKADAEKAAHDALLQDGQKRLDDLRAQRNQPKTPTVKPPVGTAPPPPPPPPPPGTPIDMVVAIGTTALTAAYLHYGQDAPPVAAGGVGLVAGWAAYKYWKPITGIAAAGVVGWMVLANQKDKNAVPQAPQATYQEALPKAASPETPKPSEKPSDAVLEARVIADNPGMRDFITMSGTDMQVDTEKKVVYYNDFKRYKKKDLRTRTETTLVTLADPINVARTDKERFVVTLKRKRETLNGEENYFNDASFDVYDLADGKHKVNVAAHAKPINVLELSEDGTRLVTAAADDPNVLVWDTKSWNVVSSLPIGPIKPLDSFYGARLSVSANGSLMAVFDPEKGGVSVHEVSSGKHLGTARLHKGPRALYNGKILPNFGFSSNYLYVEQDLTQIYRYVLFGGGEDQIVEVPHVARFACASSSHVVIGSSSGDASVFTSAGHFISRIKPMKGSNNECKAISKDGGTYYTMFQTSMPFDDDNSYPYTSGIAVWDVNGR